jgi:hypothetical protein
VVNSAVVWLHILLGPQRKTLCQALQQQDFENKMNGIETGWT